MSDRVKTTDIRVRTHQRGGHWWLLTPKDLDLWSFLVRILFSCKIIPAKKTKTLFVGLF